MFCSHWGARSQAASGPEQSDSDHTPAPPLRAKLFRSITNTLSRTGSFRSAISKKRKPEVGSLSTGTISEVTVVKEKPKENLIGKIFRRKRKENNEDEFYELGYIDPATKPANRKPDFIDDYEEQRPEMSEVYDDINSEDVSSGLDQAPRPKSRVLPPRTVSYTHLTLPTRRTV